MKTVRELLKHKGTDVVTVATDASVFDALTIMDQKNIGAVLVVAENDEVAGIVTERDYARKVILQGRTSKDTSVTDIMTAKVVFVDLGTSIDKSMALMTEMRCRHLPVLEDGKVRGIISIGDVVRAVIHDKEILIDQLEHYISGSL
ncbi:MAG: CBS domain-containing protein [Spirochaeta sp.]|jgi:CBS domain-containing protein|nr:CBS domain-containing protein [Spirochaeta sp.]